MRILLLLLICLTSIGCAVTVDLPQEKIDQIPPEANRVDLYTDDMIGDSFEKVKVFLTENGFTIKEENELFHRLETNLKEAGQRTKFGITLRVAPIDNGSKIEAIGTWSSDVEEATFASASQGTTSEDMDFWQATWGGSSRSNYAYSQLVLLFDKYPAREIRYVKQ